MSTATEYAIRRLRTDRESAEKTRARIEEVQSSREGRDPSRILDNAVQLLTAETEIVYIEAILESVEEHDDDTAALTEWADNLSRTIMSRAQRGGASRSSSMASNLTDDVTTSVLAYLHDRCTLTL